MLRRMTEPEARHTNGAKQLFQDEVQVLATLEHPNITRWDISLTCACTSVLTTTRPKRGGQLECGLASIRAVLIRGRAPIAICVWHLGQRSLGGVISVMKALSTSKPAKG